MYYGTYGNYGTYSVGSPARLMPSDPQAPTQLVAPWVAQDQPDATADYRRCSAIVYDALAKVDKPFVIHDPYADPPWREDDYRYSMAILGADLASTHRVVMHSPAINLLSQMDYDTYGHLDAMYKGPGIQRHPVGVYLHNHDAQLVYKVVNGGGSSGRIAPKPYFYHKPNGDLPTSVLLDIARNPVPVNTEKNYTFYPIAYPYIPTFYRISLFCAKPMRYKILFMRIPAEANSELTTVYDVTEKRYVHFYDDVV